MDTGPIVIFAARVSTIFDPGAKNRQLGSMTTHPDDDAFPYAAGSWA
jgi:hypothetical protein